MKNNENDLVNENDSVGIEKAPLKSLSCTSSLPSSSSQLSFKSSDHKFNDSHQLITSQIITATSTAPSDNYKNSLNFFQPSIKSTSSSSISALPKTPTSTIRTTFDSNLVELSSISSTFTSSTTSSSASLPSTSPIFSVSSTIATTETTTSSTLTTTPALVVTSSVVDKKKSNEKKKKINFFQLANRLLRNNNFVEADYYYQLAMKNGTASTIIPVTSPPSVPIPSINTNAQSNPPPLPLSTTSTNQINSTQILQRAIVAVNRALCHLQLQQYQTCIDLCEHALILLRQESSSTITWNGPVTVAKRYLIKDKIDDRHSHHHNDEIVIHRSSDTTSPRSNKSGHEISTTTPIPAPIPPQSSSSLNKYDGVNYIDHLSIDDAKLKGNSKKKSFFSCGAFRLLHIYGCRWSEELGNVAKEALRASGCVKRRQRIVMTEIKAHYYLGESKMNLGRLDHAYRHLQLAHDLSQQNHFNFGDEITYALRRIKREIDERDNGEMEKSSNEFFQFLYQLFDKKSSIDDLDDEKLEQFRNKLEEVENLSKLFHQKRINIPDTLCGKISFELMTDPVITPDGITYDRTCIEQHLQRIGRFDPLTRQSLTRDQLVPNLALKELINDFMTEYKIKRYEPIPLKSKK
ncbi:hypothetical protein SNEBB_003753 [Seison nebaliae]|nr:hypothetical protein SNEBB_003753 [Seison nebaliae]